MEPVAESIPDKGIRDVYEITGVRTITARDAKQLEGTEVMDDIRLAFELTYRLRKNKHQRYDQGHFY